MHEEGWRKKGRDVKRNMKKKREGGREEKSRDRL